MKTASRESIRALAPCPSVREVVLSARAGELDAARLAEECLARIEARSDLNAFLWVNGDAPLEAAAGRGGGRPLEGLPLALKDNVDTAGIPTTSGSPVDRERVPATDAPVWRRLRDDAGAVLLGKTHMSEFAYRSHHPALGPVRNPRAPDRATGGSSSGSAAAVAAGLVPAAVGTDTGGSVRIPASYCGVVGLKGTRGRIETEGLVPLSTTMDHVGILARSATDAALVYEQMVVEPERLTDPVTLTLPRPDPRKLRLGVVGGYLGHAERGVAARVEVALRLLESAGCVLVPVEVPEARRWRAAHKTILVREAWLFHAPRLAEAAPYGAVFRDAIAAGARLGRDYERAVELRAEAVDAVGAIFRDLDVLALPTTPSAAPLADEGRSRLSYTRCTTFAAFTGAPAISIPAGSTRAGLPVGVQFVAAHGGERTLLGAAALLEDLLAGEERP